MNLLDAGLFIYFPRDPGHKIYLKVFIYFKKLPAPPPQSTVRPLAKKGTVSTIPKKLPNALLNTYLCSTGFGLVGYKSKRIPIILSTKCFVIVKICLCPPHFLSKITHFMSNNAKILLLDSYFTWLKCFHLI